jgi:hypothetical protein
MENYYFSESAIINRYFLNLNIIWYLPINDNNKTPKSSLFKKISLERALKIKINRKLYITWSCDVTVLKKS